MLLVGVGHMYFQLVSCFASSFRAWAGDGWGSEELWVSLRTSWSYRHTHVLKAERLKHSRGASPCMEQRCRKESYAGNLLLSNTKAATGAFPDTRPRYRTSEVSCSRYLPPRFSSSLGFQHRTMKLAFPRKDSN